MEHFRTINRSLGSDHGSGSHSYSVYGHTPSCGWGLFEVQLLQIFVIASSLLCGHCTQSYLKVFEPIVLRQIAIWFCSF